MDVDCVALFSLSGGFWSGVHRNSYRVDTAAVRIGWGREVGDRPRNFFGQRLFLLLRRWLMLWVTPEEKVAIRAKGWALIH